MQVAKCFDRVYFVMCVTHLVHSYNNNIIPIIFRIFMPNRGHNCLKSQIMNEKRVALFVFETI